MTAHATGRYVPAPAHGGCATGKVQFANRKQAKKVRRRMGDSSLGVYVCEDCTWLHLGHQPPRVRNGSVDKADWLGTKGNR